MKKFLLSIVALCAANAAMAEITIDQVAGYYQETCSITGDGSYIASKENAVDTVKIAKTGEATVMIQGLLGDANSSLEGIVDLTAKTITIAPQTIFSWYILCGATETDPVVATIGEDGNISLENANISIYNTIYGSSVKSTLVRYADNTESIETLFSVPAQVIVYDENYENIIYTGNTTLTKTNEEGYNYTIADYCGLNVPAKFYIDADSCAHFNGYAWGDYDYFYYPEWLGNYSDCFGFCSGYSEAVDNGAEGGYVQSWCWYYPDLNDTSNEGYGLWFVLNWGNEMVSINTVEAEKRGTPAFLLNGARANNAKGLLVKDGKVLFVK